VANASGGGSTIQDPEGFNNRHWNWRAARLGAISGVLGGLLAAGIGVVGIWLGAGIAADRDDARSDREFIRTQRVALYGEYLAAVDEAQRLIEPVGLDVEPDGAFVIDSAALDAEQIAALEEASNHVVTLQGRIYVIGGDEVASASQDLTSHITSMSLFAVYVARCQADVNFDDGCAGIDEGQLSGSGTDPASSPELELARRHYMVTARQEMQVPE
jgi:hypothetical protein